MIFEAKRKLFSLLGVLNSQETERPSKKKEEEEIEEIREKEDGAVKVIEEEKKKRDLMVLRLFF